MLFEGKPGNTEHKEARFPHADGLLALADGDGYALPVARPGGQASRAVLAALRDSELTLEFDEDNFLCLRYGQAVHVLCAARHATMPAGMPDLLKQKTLLGAVATRTMGEDGYRMSHLLLAEPVAGLACSVHVMLQDRCGELTMAGWGELAHGQLLFHLHTVNRPGAVPAAIAGCLGDGRLDITHAAAGTPGVVH